MPTADDGRLMDMALSLAAREIGMVGSRPAVGAVIASGSRVLGRGATGSNGRPHAETVALEMARQRYGTDAARGATAYVSLEPCAHHGRTPPCADALVAAGIARVVAPIEDPDPRVSGRGFARLRAAGVTVETGLRADEANEVNRGFFSRIRRGRPWLTLKLATTLDGRIATGSGESRWITGPEARRQVHLMRLRADAVLIGAGTARADDPMLNVRGFGPDPAHPARAVLDPRLSLEPGCRLVASAVAVPLILIHGPESAAGHKFADTPVQLVEVPTDTGGRLDLSASLKALGDKGANSVLCEGGGTLAAALLAEGLVDEIVLFSAGKVIGSEGVPAMGKLGLAHLADAPNFTLRSVGPVGNDTMSYWRQPVDQPA